MPILMSQKEWDRIVKWTDPNKEDPEAARVREYLARLQQQSHEMTKTWPNSLENVNKRNEEMRRARHQAAENANTSFYRKYIKKKKVEQQRMLHSARDTVFKNTDAPKLLLNGVVESVVLKEREEQIKFDNTFLKGQMKEQQRLYEESVLQKAKEWHQLQAEKKKRRFEVNKQHQKELIQQREEVSGNRRRLHEEEILQQQRDNENAAREMEAIEKFDREYKEKEKARIWRDNTQSVKESEARRQEQKNRDLMDDMLIEVLKRSQCQVEQKRRDTEKRLRDEKLAILAALAKRLEVGTAASDAREQASFERALAEKTAAIEARHQAGLDKTAKMAREKRELRQQFLRDEERRLHEEGTMKTFAIMNRFKNNELYAEYMENKREEKIAKTQKYKEEILAQRKEREERDAKEKADTRHFYGEFARQKFREADNKLFTHAAALIEEAQAHGRPIRPILKAVDRYCKVYRLYPMPDLPKSMQEHFKTYKPWDGSKMDPWYKPPPPPPPEYDPDKDEDDSLLQRTDGLQDLLRGQTSKPAPAPAPPAPAADYRRQGRADGLQQKPPPPPPPATPAPAKEKTTSLPPVIAMSPCALHECLCKIKGAL